MRIIDVRTGLELFPGGNPLYHWRPQTPPRDQNYIDRAQHRIHAQRYNVAPVSFATPTWIRVLELEPHIFGAQAFVEGVRMDSRAGAAGATNARPTAYYRGWMPLDVRWMHPQFPLQHIGFLDDAKLDVVPYYNSPVVGFSPYAGKMW